MRFSHETEAKLAAKVVAELQRQGYATYEEVSGGYGASRADVVAVRGAVLMVVECKVGFSLKLMDQLTQWLGLANYVVGACGFTKLGVAARRYLTTQGIGLWTVGFKEIHSEVSPRLHRRASVRLRDALRPEQQSREFAAAGTQGGYWTPFRATCRELTEIAKREPGIELRAALKLFKHHYANDRSALSSVPDVVKRGLLPGIRCEDRPLKLYPVQATATIPNVDSAEIQERDRR